MPRVSMRQIEYPVVDFNEVIVTSVSVKASDDGNPEPASFYVDAIVNGDETKFTVSGLPAAEFAKWASLPPVPVRVRTQLRFGEFNGDRGASASIRWHTPAIMGYAPSMDGLLSGNGKQAKS